MKTKFVYPAVFAEQEKGYAVRVPDVDGCVTSGRSLEEAMCMAQDALCLMLYDMQESGVAIPPTSDIRDITCGQNEFVTLIACDTLEYRKYYSNKAVKKTLSIPAWLNTLAEREGINFSFVLQKALKKELELE